MSMKISIRGKIDLEKYKEYQEKKRSVQLDFERNCSFLNREYKESIQPDVEILNQQIKDAREKHWESIKDYYFKYSEQWNAVFTQYQDELERLEKEMLGE